MDRPGTRRPSDSELRYIPQFQISDGSALEDDANDEDRLPVVANDFLTPGDNRQSYLSVRSPGSYTRSGARSRSYSHSQSHSRDTSRSNSPTRRSLSIFRSQSPLSLLPSISRNSDISDDRLENMSFMDDLVGADDISELKADIKSALGDGEDNSGAWLAPAQSRSKNNSKASLLSHDSGIELDVIKSRDGEYQDNEPDSLADASHAHQQQRGLQNTKTLTVGDLFKQIYDKFVNNDGGRFGYKRGLPKLDEEQNIGDSFESRPQLPIRLYGNSLKLFSPQSKLRHRLANILLNPWADRVCGLILLLQVALLAYRQWNPETPVGVVTFGVKWSDWFILAINVLFTVEIVIKCIAWGMWDDSQAYKAFSLQYLGLRELLRLHRVKEFFLPKGTDYTLSAKREDYTRPLMFSTGQEGNLPVPRAYLRGSWNRVDFVSTICFWLNFFLSIDQFNSRHHISLFRALECLRVLRITTLTERIGLLMKSIKLGLPQIIDVLIFFAYFWTLFSIIGVQSFKSSLRRYCVWTNPDDPSDTYQTEQYCGGSYYRKADGTLGRRPYVLLNGERGPRAKGFLCPVNSECTELENANQNTFSYDNILNSFQMTFVIMSANTFTDIMYDLMYSESLAASIYFVCGTCILFLWMVNLLIAVINSSFSIARETDEKFKKKGTRNGDVDLDFDFVLGWPSRIYTKVRKLFDLLTVLGLIFSSSSTDGDDLLFRVQCSLSFIFVLEIIWRFFCYYPEGSRFFKVKRNIFDLLLTLVTLIMAIPNVAQNMGRVYAWLTVFQIARFYRCVLLLPFVRRLWVQVWGSVNLILDLSLFYFLLTFACSIIFARYFEGYATFDDDILFPLSTLPNVFLALYVITSTENWTEILYEMQTVAPNKASIFFLTALTIIWFILSNTIVFNLFIGIIGDSLKASEPTKRREQVKKFVFVDFPRRLKAMTKTSVLQDLRLRVFHGRQDRDMNLEVEKLLLNGAAVQQFLQDELNESEKLTEDDVKFYHESDSKFMRFIQRNYVTFLNLEPVKKLWRSFFWDTPDSKNPFFTDLKIKIAGTDYTTLHTNYQTETQKADEEKLKFLRDNPNFNRTLYLFTPRQPLRKICQYICKPSVGVRYFGVEPNRYANSVFSIVVVAGTVSVVVSACITTPLYRNITLQGVWNWPFEVELAFSILFMLEFLIKVVADGLIFTPNAYFLNSWNWIDFIVLVSLWIDVVANLYGDQVLGRAVSGIKALRALRFLSISETSRDIFHKVIIAGFGKIISASLLSITLIVPFAAWGVNLFKDRLSSCNDGSGLDGCIAEYSTEVLNWNILMPKVYSAPILEMDDFGSSLLTLFEIISLEGWVDLLENMVNSTGVGTPMRLFASPENALFVVIFIFIGIVFTLTLFISVIITNYARLSGSAFLTLQQTSWNEVRKLLSQAQPRKRPVRANLGPFRQFCFQFAVEKSQAIIALLQFFTWIHILAILLEMYPSPDALDDFRYSIYITSSTILLLFTLMKLVALGPKTFFKVRWNAYEFIVYMGAFITSFISFFVSRNTIFANINKLFLVGIFTMLIHSSNRLSHLLKIASASLPSLLSLVLTWGVLFLVFAIALNQFFGLTKVGPNTSSNLNLRTVPKALILLFRNSFGEAWNYTMRDFAIESPFCTNSGVFNTTDCGDRQYAYIIFILWNIISMYIFVNMFISLIFENFSYIYKDKSGTRMLTREEIRHFKTVWSEFDPMGTGYIPLSDLSAFLGELQGYFSFKVYEGRWTIPELKKAFIVRRTFSTNLYDVDVDIDGLNRRLRQLDVDNARSRIKSHQKFLEEVRFNMERYDEPGVSFHRVILMIPLYSRFDENNCLQLTEFLDRLVVSRKILERSKLKRRLEVLQMVLPRLSYLRLKGGLKAGAAASAGRPTLVLSRFKDLRDDSSLFESPFSPQVPRAPRMATPRNSFDKSVDNSYWSPPSRAARGSRSEDDLMDELSGIAGDLKNSLWRNELKDVGDDLNAALNRRSRLLGHNAEDASDEDVTVERFSFDESKNGVGSNADRKIT